MSVIFQQKNAVYVVKPNINGYRNYYKLGKTMHTGSRLGRDYTTLWPTFLGGFNVYGILNVDRDELSKKELLMFDLAPAYNFHRVTAPTMTEFFEYKGLDVYADARRLLVAVRARGPGNLFSFTPGGHSFIIPRMSYGNESKSKDNILTPFHMNLKNKRQYTTVNGSQRALRAAPPPNRRYL